MPAHLIVFANEKGGSGKSTNAVHVAVALAAAGRRVAAIDLDTRQRSLARYLENRVATMRRTGFVLPVPQFSTFDPGESVTLAGRLDALQVSADIVIVDTPGRDDANVRTAIQRADTLVTPINDSFVDLDLIGEVDPETYEMRRPSFYASLVWEARRARANRDRGAIDWVVMRNRLQHLEARNMRRVGAALDSLAGRVGFRVVPGLSERVVYRSLFPKGLTLLDLDAIGDEAALAHVAGRQEMRAMLAALSLSAAAGDRPLAAAA